MDRYHELKEVAAMVRRAVVAFVLALTLLPLPSPAQETAPPPGSPLPDSPAPLPCDGAVILQQMAFSRESIGFNPSRDEISYIHESLAALLQRYFGRSVVLAAPGQIAAAGPCGSVVVKAELESYRCRTTAMVNAVEAKVKLAFFKSAGEAQADFSISASGADMIVGGTAASAYVGMAVSAAARELDKALAETDRLYARPAFSCDRRICMELMELSETQVGITVGAYDRMRLNALLLDAVRKGFGEYIEAASGEELSADTSCKAVLIRPSFSVLKDTKSLSAELKVGFYQRTTATKAGQTIVTTVTLPVSPRGPSAVDVVNAFKTLSRQVESKVKAPEFASLMNYLLPSPRDFPRR